MDAVFSFFKGIVDLGAAVMLPIVLIIIGSVLQNETWTGNQIRIDGRNRISRSLLSR